MTQGLYLRAATQHDQQTIQRMIREAGINPLGLHWPRFLIAQEGEEIVGIGQVKVHSDGSRELASIAVIPARQRQGIATALIRELLRREDGVVYLYCRDTLETFYEPFGFRRVPGAQLPSALRRMYRLAEVSCVVVRALTGQPLYVFAMRRAVVPQ